MLQFTPHMRLLVCVEPIDFRNGIDGLVRICRATLAEDPFRGTVFVFRNRRATAVKVLAYDGQGFWLCQKRLSTGNQIESSTNSRRAGEFWLASKTAATTARGLGC